MPRLYSHSGYIVNGYNAVPGRPTHLEGQSLDLEVPMTSAIASLAIGALLVWLIAAVADPWRELTADPPTGPPHVRRAEVVHISILAPPRQVIEFLIDAHNWPKWAPWIHSVSRTSEHGWTFATDVGPMRVRFVEHNTLGVLDHEVTLASGVTVLNSMRVVPNDSGSELVMVVFQSPDASKDEFERDIQSVREDLARIKTLSEAMALEAAGERTTELTG
jgi:Polyketide cyclase / dehydrase and lipid transport